MGGGGGGMGTPRRFDPMTQVPQSSAQTTELNPCSGPNSKVKVFLFCKNVHTKRKSRETQSIYNSMEMSRFKMYGVSFHVFCMSCSGNILKTTRFCLQKVVPLPPIKTDQSSTLASGRNVARWSEIDPH